MRYRFWSFLAFLLFPLCCWTQTNLLKELIRSPLDPTEKQQQIDQFFIQHKNMPKDSLADCWHDVGLRWYFSQGWRRSGNETSLQSAIHFTQQAANLKRELAEVQVASLQKSLSNLAYFLQIAEQAFEAIKVNTEIVNLDLVNRKTYNAYRQLAAAYTMVGDYYKARTTLEQGIVLNKKDQKNKDKLALAYYELASSNADLGYVANAQDIQKQLTLADSLNLLSKAKENDKIKLSNNIAHLRGNLLLETEEYEAAKLIFEKLTTKTDQFTAQNLAILYNSLGVANLKLTNYKKAILQFKRAIAADNNYSAPLENLGDCYLQQEQHYPAMVQYQAAIGQQINQATSLPLRELPAFKELQLAPNKYYLLNHLIQKANGWLAYYQAEKDPDHLQAALETFHLADKLIDVIRQESLEEQSKLFWLEKGTSLYLQAVGLCQKLNKPEEAFYFMEKNKALLLLSDLSNEEAKTNGELPEAMANREFELKRKIYLLEDEWQRSTDWSATEKTDFQNIIYTAKNEFEKFTDSLSLAYPDYARAKKQIDILSYAAFKKKYLSSDEIVVHYILNEKQGYGLWSSAGESSLFVLADTEKIEKDILSLNGFLSKPIFTQESLDQQEQLAQHLFSTLIPTSLATSVTNKKITIVPDYVLQMLPFEILQPDPGEYFIENADIRYAYSMSYLDLNSRKSRATNYGFAAFAPREFNDPNLPELSFSQEELYALNEICRGDVFINTAANKNAFLTNNHLYNIIHLSTHADAGSAINPWIAFSDQKLYLQELYATKNQAELVVLSACNTSLGELKQGEGAMSLARGFFYAGTNSVVSSLWSTNDKVNKSLMVDFYQGLAEGKTKSTALRTAKLNYLRAQSGSEASPFYWAANILIGDNSPVELSKGWSLWNWLGIAFVFALLLFLYTKYK